MAGDVSKMKAALLMWLAGMVGAVVLTVAMVPQVVDVAELPMPFWALVAVSALQTGVLLALAVWAGIALAHRVGLRAPAVYALASGGRLGDALAVQWRAGVIAGVAGGIGLYAASGFAPVFAEAPPVLPLAARVLYGGITEELLLRWGLMTLIAFLAWKAVQRGVGAPSASVIGFAIVVSAVLFAAGHLPAAAALAGGLTGDLVTYVLGVNTMFGVLFGWLYSRYGLEAAIIAHALAHVVAFTLGA